MRCLLTILSFIKVIFESLVFLERRHEDTCGSIHPPCGSFCYFMILIDIPIKRSHVCLLFAWNIAFIRLFAQIIKSQTQFLDYPIKTIHLDNVGKFTSHYCMLIKLDIEFYVMNHTHIQNGLVESFIKWL